MEDKINGFKKIEENEKFVTFKIPFWSWNSMEQKFIDQMESKGYKLLPTTERFKMMFEKVIQNAEVQSL